ncbi:MAG: energy-coupling factor ABC transporter permease [Burkholderiales bacterium]
MDVAAVTLSPAWFAGSALAALGILAYAVRRAPWRRFASSEAVHVWYGTIFALVVLWSVRATIGQVVVIHLLGTAGFALAAGGPLALVGGALVAAVSALVHGTPVADVPLVFLLSVALPAGVALALLRATQRFLPPNFFVYAFAGGFLGPALGFGVAGVASATVLVLTGAGEADVVFGEYVPILLYLAFAEGTLSGMVVTLLVVYRPQWVATFDDARYLHRR